jgi:putative two-component system response regulator
MSPVTRILFVDDEVRILDVYTALLEEEGYHVTKASRAEDAVSLVTQYPFDIVFLDQFLGSVKGLELMGTLSKIRPDLSFIIITANGSTDLAVESLKRGAADFIMKPFLVRDLTRSIDHVKRERELECAKKHLVDGLEQAVNEKTEELKRVYTHVLSSLANAMEQRDRGTYGHSRRVSQIARLIAAALNLGEQERTDLKTAALLHDIGKIGITDFIIAKVGPLSDEEREVIRSHPQKGVEILRPLKQYERILPAILHHHESYDGSGYPAGLAGEQIPLHARIISIADTYDAIISTRPYRKGSSHAMALEELDRFGGRQFDPRIVRAFTEADRRYESVRDRAAALSAHALP